MIEHISIKVGDKVIELTLDEMKELYRELRTLFGEGVTYPYPYYPQYPYWGTGTGTGDVVLCNKTVE